MMDDLDAIVRLGCIVCWKFHSVKSPAEIHHLRTDVGMGQKSDQVIPLCPLHHRTGGYGIAYHAGRKGFEKAYTTEMELWRWVQDLLYVSEK